MAEALNVNNLTVKSQKVYGSSLNSNVGSVSGINALRNTNKSSKSYDYSAIKLTDIDKYYRMEIKKQSDSLLKAAQEITNLFPTFSEQMLEGLNSFRAEIEEDMNEESTDKYDEISIEDTDNYKNQSANEQISHAKTPANTESISNAISSFVDKFNDFYNKAKESNSYAAQSTVNRMELVVSDYQEPLKEIGITAGASEIAVNKDKLESSIAENKTEQLFTGENSFLSKVSKIAEESSANSDKFIEKTNARSNSRPVRNTSVNYNYITNASIDN